MLTQDILIPFLETFNKDDVKCEIKFFLKDSFHHVKRKVSQN